LSSLPFDLIPPLGIIGNVSKSTGILLLNGENDSQTPVQQAFLLQQRLTDVNHPDHTSFISMVYWSWALWTICFSRHLCMAWGPFRSFASLCSYSFIDIKNGF